ncbi:hypothetical protein PPL_04639 [Heterostelium album PN500]|uniref:Uncharacterized protein n=1 Tax=Heterostelium pallidum (strain ATCC 26659 / Pp 5 / PN500) TaxID=670386 RepID=D3B848_HETP5|nr:hypothetical protein PPL_04639 [Heterostelium album PN500]EFA82216.1 hypothetical protein PPL_04639 [Heterostelium album PN500]|eukprot:XP_020434333.1 hypothetical protein PPL_04639 [Heterostelium album PN500]
MVNLSKFFKRKSSSSQITLDKLHLNEMAETRFYVEQLMIDASAPYLNNNKDNVNSDEIRRKKLAPLGPQQRIICINVDGIKLITGNEKEVLEEIEWSSIDHIKLQQNLIIWEVYLKNKRQLYFKSQKAYHLHCATDHFIESVVRSNLSNECQTEY